MQLERMVRAAALPPSLLFTGPEGSGKELLAVALAAMLNCDASGGCDPRCPACNRIATLEHPDLHLVFPVPYGEAEGGTRVVLEARREDFFGTGEFGNRARSIGIDLVRGVLEAVSKQPYEGKYSVVILFEAHLATTEAQNAILKLLEEPPSSAVLVLTTRYPDRLLPTVLSRCQEIRTEPIPDERTAEFLGRFYSVEGGEARRIAALAGGNLRRGIRFFDDRFIGMRRDAVSLVKLAYAGRESEILSEVEGISGEYTRDEVERILEEAVIAVRLLMREYGSVEGRKLLAETFGEDMARLAVGRDFPSDLRRIQRAADNLRRNVDVELTLSQLFLDLAGKWY